LRLSALSHMNAPTSHRANKDLHKKATRRVSLWPFVLVSLLVSSVLVTYMLTRTYFRGELDEANAVIDEANAVISELRPNLETTKSELDQAQARLLAVESELDNARRVIADAKLEVSEQEEQIAKLQAEKRGLASCEDFFDQWALRGVPSSISAIAALGREAAAAKDCLEKGDVASACKHWQVLLTEVGKVGPPVNESRHEIMELMRQNNCKALTEVPAR
jgi:Cobalamin adenosyltransferase